MDTIIEIKEGVQGMNLDPVTALLFEQSWLQRLLKRVQHTLDLAHHDLSEVEAVKEQEQLVRKLADVDRRIEDLGNKTFNLWNLSR